MNDESFKTTVIFMQSFFYSAVHFDSPVRRLMNHLESVTVY